MRRPFLRAAEWEKFKKVVDILLFLPPEYRFDICVHVFLCIKTHAFAGFVVAFRVSCHHTILELQETPKTKGGSTKKTGVLYNNEGFL